MSAYKQFTTKDVSITPFDPNKRFSFSGSQIPDAKIELYSGIKPTINLWISSSATTTGTHSIENTTGVYNSAKQLYYSNYLTSSKGDIVPTQSIVPGVSREFDEFVGQIESPRFDNYLQTTLTQSRFFPTSSLSKITTLSIPSTLWGNNIVPKTFECIITSSGNYSAYTIKDDGEGNLILDSTSSVGVQNIASYGSGSGSYGSSSYGPIEFEGHLNDVVGQIFYSHGIAVFTTPSMLTNLGHNLDNVATYTYDYVDFSYSSSVRIYENQYKCGIRENEFEYSLNPTLLSGSNDDVYYDFATGSVFAPYVTCVGLYNENNELLVVGKLSQPVPISQYVDTTIIVNFDLS